MAYSNFSKKETKPHYGIMVYKNGISILDLSKNEISGKKNFSIEEEEAIRNLAMSILSFIGKGK